MRAKTVRTSKKDPTETKAPVKEASKFPIVAIGASAGGLEALEQFLGNVPEKSGMAYIVIQHLDPTQKGMLPELLQRVTKMPVRQVKDRTAVKINTVYVIPPNTTMSVLKRVLHLFEPVESRGLRLPIDFFFHSLADDINELAVGVILSGMGSDGSQGLRTIKEKNGIVMVQDPNDAKFDSMPRSVIESVLVDIIAPARELPEKLIDYLKHIPGVRTDLSNDIKDKSSLEKIIILLRTHTGNDFSSYKKNTLYRRIERRMTVHKIDKIVTYVHFLQGNHKEVEILFKELLIGVTNFFRDSQVWVKLKENILPGILASAQQGSVIRAWIPGCSTGEEAYSLAIVFKEALDEMEPRADASLQIFATDIDAEAIDTARKGYFPVNIAADVSPERLSRYFISTDDGYRIKTEIREMVVFAQHNIILHPPFTKIDILSCRNLLIYMDSDLQKKIISLFYYSINPKGVLLLGNSESLGNQENLFTTVDSKMKIYTRALTNRVPELLNFPSSFTRPVASFTERPVAERPAVNIQTLADQFMLENYAPPGVLVNEFGDIIYIHGHTGRYLEPAVGKANLNIFAMIREALRNEFHLAFRRVVTKKEHVLVRNLKIRTNGNTQTLNIDIKWVDKPELLYGTVLVTFIETSETADIRPRKPDSKTVHGVRIKELEAELHHMREVSQNTLEEIQTSQEELRSANEELQSTNEELQSANEELTTSKEEMQSLNEELQTVNAELMVKVDDYSRVNNDMKNLLNSTEIATLFLDKELNIRRFTHQVTTIFKLIKSDIGRPFTDLTSDLQYPELSDDAREVLRTLVFLQKEIPSRDGRWFQVRIMPYRTFDDRIDGLVITFINISAHKKIEDKLFESEKLNRILLNTSSEIKIILANDLRIMDLSPTAELFFGKKREDCKGKIFIEIFVSEKSGKSTKDLLDAVSGKGISEKIKMNLLSSNGKMISVDCLVTPSMNHLNIAEGMTLSIIHKLDYDT
jgi:two-component system CheB/CheR fusion protein